MITFIGTKTHVLVLVGTCIVIAFQIYLYNVFATTPIAGKESEEPFQILQRFTVPANHPTKKGKRNATASSPTSGLSVIISVFRQPKCLQQMVRYFRLCPVVQEIRVNWFQNTSMLLNIPEDYFAIAKSNIPVHFDVFPNNISYRYSPYRSPSLVSNATFHVDVDTLYSCRALEFAYDTWVNQFDSSRQTVVGFHPRYLKSKGRYYHVTESYQYPFRYNTIFATKGAILHKDVMETFFQPQYQSWRDLADYHVTAEDMLMSFVLASHNVSTVPLCIEPEDTCSLVCAQGKQIPLAQSTASIRPQILDQLFDSFDNKINLFQPKQGSNAMIWFNDSTKEWRCYSAPSSQQSISVANRKCKWFCDNTPICPMNPRRKDSAEEW